MKKKGIKRYIPWIVLGLIALLLGLMPAMARSVMARLAAPISRSLSGADMGRMWLDAKKACARINAAQPLRRANSLLTAALARFQ